MKIVDSGCRTQAVILSTTLAIRRVFCNKRIQLSLLVSSTGSVESRPDSYGELGTESYNRDMNCRS